MGKKHGEWFDLEKHLAIHDTVIEDFEWRIQSGDTRYRIDRFKEGEQKFIRHEIKFKTTNSLLVEIKKKTILSTDKKYGLTRFFSYNCFDLEGKPVLQYHSRHSYELNPLAPWHHHCHRHQYMGKVQKIVIYHEDDRPEDQRESKYTWGNDQSEVDLTYTSDDWPFF